MVHSIAYFVAFVADLVVAAVLEPGQEPEDTAADCMPEGPPADEAELVDSLY